MPLSRNALGQTYALTLMTPIAPGAEPSLRTLLEGLREGDGVSPLSRLPRTHFGRWVIVPDFVPDPGQRRGDTLGIPYLLFSATFDGELDPYLDELCAEPTGDVERIWGSCIGAPQPARGPALKAYLLHNQIPTGLFFSAYPEATVQQVRHSLSERDRVVAFAVRAQQMDPAELQRAFLEEF